MAPPCFGDLGKDARDLFSKGFHNGIVKLDLKTVAENKVEFKLSGSHVPASAQTNGKLEAKLKCSKWGSTITETWDTKNLLGVKLELEDQLLKGLKLTLDSNFNASTGAKDGVFKAGFKHSLVNLSLDSGLQIGPPVLNGSIVFGCPAVGHEGWLAGGNVQFDSAKKAVNKHEFALGYDKNDLKLLTSVKNLSEFGGSVYHKVNRDTEVGVDISWVSGTAATKFGVAAKHKLDQSSHVNLAIDNKSNIKLGYTNSIKPGVKVTFAGSLDGKAISGGDHKIGLGLDLDLS